MTNASISFLERYLGFVLCAFLTTFYKTITLFGARSSSVKAKKIVFVKFIEQGALVLHLGTFKEAAMQYGAENIFLCTFLSNAPLTQILNVFPEKNQIFINEKSFSRFCIDFIMALLTIRAKSIDSVIDLEFYSRATAIFCFLSGASKRAGYHRYQGSQNYRGDLFTHKLSYSHYVHLAESSWSLLKSLELPVQNLPALDVPARNFKTTEMQFTPGSDDLIRLGKLLDYPSEIPERLLVINPSLNDALPLRKWPAENYRKFILQFNERFPGHQFVFTGREDEYTLTEEFIRSLSLSNTVNLCGKTHLRDVLTLYSKSKLLLTSDSGPAHFSTLTDINTIVLFGPETPVLYGPLSEKAKVLYLSLPCSPCFNVYNNRLSPCRDNVCLKRITVEQVMEAAQKIFAGVMN